MSTAQETQSLPAPKLKKHPRCSAAQPAASAQSVSLGIPTPLTLSTMLFSLYCWTNCWRLPMLRLRSGVKRVEGGIVKGRTRKEHIPHTDDQAGTPFTSVPRKRCPSTFASHLSEASGTHLLRGRACPGGP